MITSKSERVVATGTNMLSKRSRITDEQAASSGKNGRADLHMHSTYSDGSATIEQILARVQQHTNLDVIALTDHDVIEGALRARDMWQRGSYRFDFVVGEEVSTKEGHLLGLFIEKQIPKGLSMERSIDLIHEQGGLAVVAHPLHKFFRHSCKRETLDRIYASQDVWLDGIETWNASFCGIYANAVAMGTNREVYRLPELGNSDAHSLSAIGAGMTCFAGTTAREVRAAIENGLTAPTGTMWDLQAYYQWVRYRSKRSQPTPEQAVMA